MEASGTGRTPTHDRHAVDGGAGRLRAVLLPAALLLAGVAALLAARLSSGASAGAVRAALERLVDSPGNLGALRPVAAHALDALRDAAPAVLALGLCAAILAARLLVRAGRRRRAGGAGAPAAPDTDRGPADAPARAAGTGVVGTGVGAPPSDGPPGFARAGHAAASGAPSAPPRSAPDPARAQLDIALAELARLRDAAALREEELRTARESRSRLVARLSHALRTPLNGIIGMTELVIAGDADEERRRHAARLTGAAQNLLGVANGLLDHAQLESGELRLQRSRFALHDAIEEGCQRRGAEAHARGVELVCYVDEDVPRDVDGDGVRLWQVIDALVANAIEHTERGEVVVRVVREGPSGSVLPGGGAAGGAGGATRSRYRCDVQDTGAGLSPESQLELWRAFRGAPAEGVGDARDASGGDADAPGALGLGLRTASELARRMGGELDVRSRLGEGSRFSFAFELGDVEQRRNVRAAPRTLRGARALIVDDNETNRTILAHQLGSWGMHVECTDGGREALAALRAARDADRDHELLVLDLHMPGMDGLELARRIAADPALPRVPVLMLTSSEIDLDAAELDALGIERNLAKPARQSVLHDTLASMLRAVDDRGRGPAAKGAGDGSDAADGEPPLLDAAALDGIRALQRPDKPDLLARVVDVWGARAPELVAEMRAAIEASDAGALAGAVHGLKSSSSYLGAARLAARCRSVEAALEPDGAAVAGLGELVDAVDAERRAVAEALADALAGFAGRAA